GRFRSIESPVDQTQRELQMKLKVSITNGTEVLAFGYLLQHLLSFSQHPHLLVVVGDCFNSPERLLDADVFRLRMRRLRRDKDHSQISSNTSDHDSLSELRHSVVRKVVQMIADAVPRSAVFEVADDLP